MVKFNQTQQTSDESVVRIARTLASAVETRCRHYLLTTKDKFSLDRAGRDRHKSTPLRTLPACDQSAHPLKTHGTMHSSPCPEMEPSPSRSPTPLEPDEEPPHTRKNRKSHWDTPIRKRMLRLHDEGCSFLKIGRILETEGLEAASKSTIKKIIKFEVSVASSPTASIG